MNTHTSITLNDLLSTYYTKLINDKYKLKSFRVFIHNNKIRIMFNCKLYYKNNKTAVQQFGATFLHKFGVGNKRLDKIRTKLELKTEMLVQAIKKLRMSQKKLIKYAEII